MATWSAEDTEIQELDAEGQIITSFKYDRDSKAIRTRHPHRTITTSASLLMRLMDVFLPAGYPATVTPDYTPYQIYDTLQAFASTIAGLLASRAVFVGMGVGDENVSLVTTMLLYIAQETIGRIATILFAHRFSQRIEAEVKFYRFFADIVNDIAFVLDCLSPGLPVLGRVCALCVSNACRAVCGVSGGSSKAILSTHFAKAGNIGELNAKDGSQETVVSLIGMWLGGIVVSKVHGTTGTWSCLVPLLTLHLWANWKAVRSVRLTSLNLDRATILFSALLQHKSLTMDEVSQRESILSLAKLYPPRPNHFQAGISVSEFLRALPGNVSDGSRQYAELLRLLDVFGDEDYVLWFNVHINRGVMLLKDTATGETQAKAYCHFLRLSAQGQQLKDLPRLSQQGDDHERHHDSLKRTAGSLAIKGKDIDIQSQACGGLQDNDQNRFLISETLKQNKKEWQRLVHEVASAGWDLSLTNLVGGRYHRIRMHDTPSDHKKDQ